MTQATFAAPPKEPRIKDDTSKYPGWEGPLFPKGIDELQRLLDSEPFERSWLDLAATRVDGFKLLRIEARPETEYEDGSHVWRVAYVYQLQGGGMAAIFLPHEKKSSLHCAVYTQRRPSSGTYELEILLKNFGTSAED